MANLTEKLTVNGDNASVILFSTLCRTLAETGCVLKWYHYEGNWNWAKLDATFEGSEQALKLAHALLAAWAS